MAKGRKTGGRNFEPGNKFSLGKQPYPEELKFVQKLPKDYFSKLINKFLSMDFMEFQNYLEDLKENRVVASVGEAYMAAVIWEGIRNKNHAVMEWLAVRTIGRVEGQQDDNTENKNTLNKQLVEFFRDRVAKQNASAS